MTVEALSLLCSTAYSLLAVVLIFLAVACLDCLFVLTPPPWLDSLTDACLSPLPRVFVNREPLLLTDYISFLSLRLDLLFFSRWISKSRTVKLGTM